MRNIVKGYLSELRLINIENALQIVDQHGLTRDGIHFKTQQGRQRNNYIFEKKIEEMERELRKWVFRRAVVPRTKMEACARTTCESFLILGVRSDRKSS